MTASSPFSELPTWNEQLAVEAVAMRHSPAVRRSLALWSVRSLSTEAEVRTSSTGAQS